MSSSIGKYRRLARLSNDNGQFAMLAIDQRQSLRSMLGEALNIAPNSVEPKALHTVKRIVTKELSPAATALLTDPIYGYPNTYDVIPKSTGVMVSIEITGYNVLNGYERHSRLIPGFSVEKALHAGADAIKLLIWYNREASVATKEHQFDIVRRIGQDCERHEIPLILEIVNYPSSDVDTRSAEYVREKAMRVIDAASTFSDPDFGVDILKLEFPGELRYVHEFNDRSFATSKSIIDLEEIKLFNRQVNEASRVPWVILSAGVDPDEFIENIKISNQAGASGFLCGRAVWKHIVDYYPDETAMTNYIRSKATAYFEEILQSNADAIPWFNRK